jgi:hypothetical protein
MSDQAGNSFTTARNIDLSNGTNQKVFADLVDANDPNDYYRFILRGRSSVSALLNSSSGNANFELYSETPTTGQRNLLSSGVNPGTTADFSSQELEAGIYYIRVFPGSNSLSNYSLTLKTQTLQSTHILWRETSSLGANQVWQMGGANMAMPIAPATAITDVPINWELAGIGDLNLDGVADFVWREAANGFTVVWYMGGVNNASLIGSAVLPQVTGNWKLAGMADFNADQRLDFVWREAASGNTLIWYMGGENGATPLSGNLLPNVPGNWQLAGVADFNQDTRPDLLWRETGYSTGQNILWYMGGEQGTTILSATTILTVATNWRVESLLDYNADGYNDIFWREVSSGISQVWFMGGGNGAQAIGAALLPQVPANWKATAFTQFTTPPKADVAGNVSGEALNIGNLSNAIFRESIGGADTADVYRFTVQERSEFKLEDSSFGDKTVVLLNGSEQEVGRATPIASIGSLFPKIPLRTLNTILNPGTYYIRVTTSTSSAVDYNLSLSMTAAPEIYKYSFTYYYNGNNNQADYYTGYVYGLRDRYTVNSWFDPNSGNNETGANGRYLIQSQTLISGAEANNSNLGKVFVDRYYDIDQGNQSYVPNNATSAIGSSYLGSEKGFLRNQTDIFNDFGVDSIEFDALTDIRAASFDIVQGTAQPGELVSVKLRLEDITNAAIVTGNVKVSFYLSTDNTITTSDVLLGTYEVNFNGGRSSNELIYNLQLPSLNQSIWQTNGRFQIGVIVDSNNAISEANEINNSNRGQGLDIDNLQVNLPIQKYTFTYYFNGTNQGAQDSYSGYFYGNAKNYAPGQWVDIRTGNNETGVNGKYFITGATTAGTTADLGKIFVSNYFNHENNTNYTPLYFWQGKTSGNAGLGSEFDYIDNDRSIDNDFGQDAAEYDVMYHRYFFEYFYNGIDRSADYYTGWVIAQAGIYSTDAQYQWFDANANRNETGFNGRYKITSWDRNATVVDVGKVFVERYFDSQTQEIFTPHKFVNQQASGTNYLGSESDFIQVSGFINQNDASNDFGQDLSVFNTPWQSAIDALSNSLGTPTTGYVRRSNGTPNVSRTYQSGAVIHWSRQYGAVLTSAVMNPVYQAAGGADGWLGVPTAAETMWVGGRRANFVGGYIFGTPERGYRSYRSAETPWTIEGNNLHSSVSNTLGQPNGDWRVAFTSPQGTLGYYRSYTSGGTIHWTAKYGPIALANYIEASYAQTGGSGGFLGHATRAEYTWNNGKRVDFEGGYIFFNGQTAQAYYTNEAPELKTIQVNRPTAGLTVGQSYDITWTDNLPENVAITLYKGTQAIRTIVADTLSDGIERWNLPTDLATGSDYYFQIKSKTRGIFGNSQTFTIIVPPPTVRVTSPNGMEAFNVGSSVTINWSDNFSENVKIELLKGNSVAWTIASSVTSNGSYQWTINSLFEGRGGSDYRIRITNVNNTTIFDDSDNLFTIRDWFDQNFQDAGIKTVLRDRLRDGELSHVDMIALFRDVQDNSNIDQLEFNDLNTLVNTSNSYIQMTGDWLNGNRVNDGSTRMLARKVVQAETANQWYTGGTTRTNLGNLSAGASASHLEKLLQKWFLGGDLPSLESKYAYGTVSPVYRTAVGSLFRNGINYQDVAQGAVGNCYFLAGLANAALRSPSTIESMFGSQDLDSDGIADVFTVRFYRKDNAGLYVRDYVTVNRTLATLDNGNYFGGGNMPFAKIGGRHDDPNTELWVALAEKAYAQMNESGWLDGPSQLPINSYLAIELGYCGGAMEDIFGRGSTYKAGVDFADKERLIQAMLSQKSIGVSSKSAANGIAANIVEQHCYVLIGYDAATDRFTLFNPWGINNGQSATKPGLINLTINEIIGSFDGYYLA